MLQRALKVGLLTVVLGCAVTEANAFWGRGCGWGCGWGYAGCCYGGYGYGGWGYYGGYAYAPYYAWGYGGWGPYYLASSNVGTSSNAAASSATSLVAKSQPSTDSVILQVDVPADAKVFVNGRPTTSTGENRLYSSNGLDSSSVYTYRVRAEFVRDGKPVAEERIVKLSPGQRGAFAFNAAPATDAQVADTAIAARR